jgi:hypothetical protein
MSMPLVGQKVPFKPRSIERLHGLGVHALADFCERFGMGSISSEIDIGFGPPEEDYPQPLKNYYFFSDPSEWEVWMMEADRSHRGITVELNDIVIEAWGFFVAICKYNVDQLGFAILDPEGENIFVCGTFEYTVHQLCLILDELWVFQSAHFVPTSSVNLRCGLAPPSMGSFDLSVLRGPAFRNWTTGQFDTPHGLQVVMILPSRHGVCYLLLNESAAEGESRAEFRFSCSHKLQSSDIDDVLRLLSAVSNGFWTWSSLPRIFREDMQTCAALNILDD